MTSSPSDVVIPFIYRAIKEGNTNDTFGSIDFSGILSNWKKKEGTKVSSSIKYVEKTMIKKYI